MNKKELVPKSLPAGARIYVAGHRGMVGSAITRKLRAEGYHNIVARSHRELDLTSQEAVKDFFRNEKIDYVVLAAAKVGGIHANNTYPADFIYQNMMIEFNVIHGAFQAGVENLLFLGSSCIYPKLAPQPVREEYLLTGPLEPTNEPYAIAKIAGIKMCEAYNRQYGTGYRSVMPTNLYGPYDNFNLENSHVIPALMRKFHLARLARQGDVDGIRKDEKRFGPIPEDIKDALGLASDLSRLRRDSSPKVVVWGRGKARREFLHVDDMASACCFVMNLDASLFSGDSPLSFFNVGTGVDIAISELAEILGEITGFDGEVTYDAAKPDGTPRKLLDVSKLDELGWKAETGLRQGLVNMYKWYRDSTA